MWGLFTDGPDYQIFLKEMRDARRPTKSQKVRFIDSNGHEYKQGMKNFGKAHRRQTFTRAIGYK